MSRNARRLGAAAATSVVALLGAELAWRLLRTSGFGPTTNPAYVVRDDLLGWRYRPGVEVRHRTADFDVAIEIGLSGFRDATPPAPDSRPVLTLGDSLTFGWGVEERAAFPALLEELTGVPIANLGVSGYGTDQEVLLFEREGASLAPRAVVVTVCGNDVEEVARRVRYGRAKPFFPGPGLDPEDAEPPAGEGWLVRTSHLARSLAKARAARAERPLGPVEVEVARERVSGLLEGLAERILAGGGGLLVVHEGEAWLGEAMAAAGVPTLDVAPALAEAARTAPVRFESDAHWTAHGHGAVAGAIAGRMEELGLLR